MDFYVLPLSICFILKSPTFTCGITLDILLLFCTHRPILVVHSLFYKTLKIYSLRSCFGTSPICLHLKKQDQL